MASRLSVTLLLAACLLAGRALAMDMGGMDMSGARASGLACWRRRSPLAADGCWPERGRVARFDPRLQLRRARRARFSRSHNNCTTM